MKTKIVLVAAALALAGCAVPADKAQNLLAANGYHDIKLGGADVFFNGCKESDDMSRAFEARAANGAPVKGVVCSGMFFRGAVIRLTNIGAADPKFAVAQGGSALREGQVVGGDKAGLCASYAAHKAEQPLVFMDDYCGAI